MSRIGLRLSDSEMTILASQYETARYQKDFEVCLRIQGLRLVSEGNREEDVARVLGVGRRTLQDWIHRYREKGLVGLRKGPFKGGQSKLTDEQKAELKKVIAEGPEKAGLETGAWTTSIVVKLVEDMFGVSYHPDHMGKILHKLGFSVQYPNRKLSKADKVAQATWLLEELPSIKKSPKRERCGALRG